VSAVGLEELTRPTWQKSYTGIDSKLRLVPDVSSVADPIPGGLVVVNGLGSAVGGSSWSSPVWAAFGAHLAEKRARKGKSVPGILVQSFTPHRNWEDCRK
jgi:subtilase family serine protease